LAFLAKVANGGSFYFGSDLQFALDQTLASCSATCTLLCNQEFILQEATVGIGWKVCIYAYTGRQPMARKYE